MGQQFYVIRNNPAPGTPAVRRPSRSATQAKAAPQGHGVAEAEASRSRRHATRPASRRPPRHAAQAADQGAAQGEEEAQGSLTLPPMSARRPAPTDRTRSEPRERPDRDPQDTEQHRRPTGDDAEAATSDDRRTTPRTTPTAEARPPRRSSALEQEGDIAADYLEELLDIADLDGDLDMDVEGDRAAVSIVGADLPSWSARNGEVLEALQELTRLAVYRETGERSRLMLDISGFRAEQARAADRAGRRDDRRGQGVRRAGVAASR